MTATLDIAAIYDACATAFDEAAWAQFKADGEIDCGVQIYHTTHNGVLLAEYRLLGGRQIRPVVLATVEAIAKAI